MAVEARPGAKEWSAVVQRLVAQADELAKAYAARPKETAGLFEASRWLGAVAAARAARSLAGKRSVADGVVDGIGRAGVRTHEASNKEGAFVDHDAPSALAVVALAVAASGEARAIGLGPRAEAARTTIAAALEPLANFIEFQPNASALDAGAPRLASTARGLALAGTVFGDRPTAIFVAPYYYDRADLQRLVHGVALEAVSPALPASEVVLLMPRGWDQAQAFEDAVRAEVARAPSGAQLPIVMRELDATRPLEAVMAATDAITGLDPQGLGAFVHPLWRERKEIAAALLGLEDATHASAIAIHHGPSLAWRVAAADLVRGAKIRVEAPVAVAPVPARFRMRSRAHHEAHPGLLRALGHATFARLGL